MLVTRAEEPGYRVVGRGDARERPKLARHHITKPPNEAIVGARRRKKRLGPASASAEWCVWGQLSAHDVMLPAPVRTDIY